MSRILRRNRWAAAAASAFIAMFAATAMGKPAATIVSSACSGNSNSPDDPQTIGIQTIDTISVSSTGDVIFDSDVAGFSILNNECSGLFEPLNDNGPGLDSGSVSAPSPNIGQHEDGWLNAEKFKGYEDINGDPFYLPGDTFVDPSEFQILGPDDDARDDPGWIHLWGADTGNPDGAGGGYSCIGDCSDPTPPSEGGLGVDLSDILTIAFGCGTEALDPLGGLSGGLSGAGSDCQGGNWSIAIDQSSFLEVQTLLGPNSFDHLAFSLKSGNEVGVYVWDFPKLLAGSPLPDLVNSGIAYTFGGTWSMSDFGDGAGRGLSHLNVWARDPINSDAPAPATLALIGIGILGMGIARRRRGSDKT